MDSNPALGKKVPSRVKLKPASGPCLILVVSFGWWHKRTMLEVKNRLPFLLLPSNIDLFQRYFLHKIKMILHSVEIDYEATLFLQSKCSLIGIKGASRPKDFLLFF